MEFVDMAWENQMGSIPEGFVPSDVTGLKLWTRFNSGITVTGAGVSQWDDVSGNGNHLLQAVDANRMTKEADGSILGNGVDQFLFSDLFTLAQPFTAFIKFKAITWTLGDVILGFGGGANRFLYQTGITPDISLDTGAVLGSVSPVLGTYGTVTAKANGASSLIQLDDGTPVTGNAGATAGTSVGIGTNNQVGSFSHAQHKELIVYSGALTTAQIAQVVNYLDGV